MRRGRCDTWVKGGPLRGGRSCDVCNEAITTARDGLDEIAIWPQRLAQCRNLELEIILLDHGPQPYAAQKLVLADKFTAGLDQNDKNIERPATDRYRYPVREKLAAVRIQTKAAK